MSHFIANTIRFNKDFSQYQVKGGDNNVIPRYNEWTDWVPVDMLYYYVTSGMMKLTDGNEKNCIVNYLISEMDYSGHYYTDWSAVKYRPQDIGVEQFTKAVEFTSAFINKLKEIMLNEYSPKKQYVIKVQGRYYVKTMRAYNFKVTEYKEWAKKYSRFKARQIAKRISIHSPQVLISG